MSGDGGEGEVVTNHLIIPDGIYECLDSIDQSLLAISISLDRVAQAIGRDGETVAGALYTLAQALEGKK